MRLKDKVVTATFKVKLYKGGVVTMESERGKSWEPSYSGKS